MACLCITHNDREGISAADNHDAADAAADAAADGAEERCHPVETSALAVAKGREREGQRLLSGDGVCIYIRKCIYIQCVYIYIYLLLAAFSHLLHALYALTLLQAVLQCFLFGA